MDFFGKIFLAKRLSFNNNKSVNLVDPITELAIPFLPTTLSFSLYGNIVTSEPKSKYKINIKLVDSNNKELLSLDGDLDNSSAVNERVIIPIEINFDNVIFREEGKHKCSLIVDGKLIDEYEFIVYNQKIE